MNVLSTCVCDESSLKRKFVEGLLVGLQMTARQLFLIACTTHHHHKQPTNIISLSSKRELFQCSSLCALSIKLIAAPSSAPRAQIITDTIFCFSPLTLKSFSAFSSHRPFIHARSTQHNTPAMTVCDKAWILLGRFNPSDFFHISTLCILQLMITITLEKNI